MSYKTKCYALARKKWQGGRMPQKRSFLGDTW